MEAGKREKEGWYPGKYMGKANRRRSVESVPVTTEDIDQSASRKLGPRVSIESTGSIQESLPHVVSPVQSLQELDSVGTLKVQVLDIKYLRLSSAKLSIQFGRAVSQYAVEGSKVIERNFDLHEVCSDIKISVVGKADNGELICGIVIVPVTSLLSFSGKPSAPKEQYRQFYPVCISRMTDGKVFKFSSGYADLPGYALNRKEPIGFVSVKVELTLHDHPFKVYLLKGSSSWKRQLSFFSWFDQDAQSDAISGGSSLSSNAELCAMINRDMSRISSLFKLPISLSLVTSVPEVFVFNGLLACLCFIVHTWQLPFLCVAFLALNGLIAHSQRNYVNTTIWNEPLPLTLVGTPADPNHSSNLPVVMDPLMFLAGAVPTSLNAYPAAAAAASAIMPPMSELLGDGGEGVSNNNGTGPLSGNYSGSSGSATSGGGGGVSSLSAAGSRLSVAVAAGSASNSADRDYETSSKPSMLRMLQTQNAHLTRVSRALAHTAHTLEVICNLFCFADSRASLIAYGFLIALATLLAAGIAVAPRVSSFVVMALVTLFCASAAFLLDLVESKAGNKRAAGNAQMMSVANVLDCFAGFLSRVPDELELTHRYIAGTAIVNAKGSEMSDAAITFEKRLSSN